MPSALSIAFAVAGLILGVAADRLATRWPEHDLEHPPGRAPGWRTIAVAATGAVAFGLLPVRFPDDTAALLIFGAWLVTLVIGLATDLDQRLLPDELTVPVIPVAIVYAGSGANPLVGQDLVGAVAVAIILPVVLYVPSIPFGSGAFGLGDVKLLAGVGLLLGLTRTFNGVLSGLLISGVVLLALLAARRITLKSFIPMGPFLIAGALVGLFLR